MEVKEYFNQLKECYLDSRRLNLDKVKDFRSIIEKFFKDQQIKSDEDKIEDRYVALTQQLANFYKVNKGYPYQVRQNSFDLINDLNHYVHSTIKDKDVNITNDDLRKIFATIIGTLSILSGEKIDESLRCIMNGVQDISGLTFEQNDIVKDSSQIIYVNAGPGTGKTFLLTNKIVRYIIESKEKENIVALSYTNTAAKELGVKFNKQKLLVDLDKEYNFISGTIHSYCYKMIGSFYENVLKEEFNYIIIDDIELEDLSNEICLQLDNRFSQEKVLEYLRSEFIASKTEKKGNFNQELVSAVDNIKNKYKIITIKEILTKFLEFIRTNDRFKNWIYNNISILLIDEAQDLGKINYEIIEEFLNVRPNLKLFIVGDPRQNIFTFLGGSFSNLNEFLLKHNNAVIKNLSITFRCPSKVVDYVNTMNFIDCENIPLISKKEEEGLFSVEKFENEDKEAEAIVQLVKRINNNKEVALLSTSLRYMLNIVNQLNKEKIPFKVFGGKKILLPHIKIFNHFMRIILNDNVYSIKRICQQYKINEKGNSLKESFFNSEIGDYITSLKKHYHEYEYDFNQIMDSLIQEISFITTFENPKEIEQSFQNLKIVTKGIEKIPDYFLSLIIDKERYEEFYKRDLDVDSVVKDETNFVTVSTIHSAKGLEWDNVILPGLSDGIFPNPFFCEDKYDSEKTKQNYNDELKKMFVATTRTKQNLYITYPIYKSTKYSQIKVPISRFLSEYKSS